MAGSSGSGINRVVDTAALSRDIDPRNIVVYDGVRPRIIKTYEQAVKLHLMEYKKNINNTDWFSLIGLILSAVAALDTGAFNNYLEIPQDMWRSLFVFVILVCTYKLIQGIIKYARSYGRNETEAFINKLKTDEP